MYVIKGKSAVEIVPLDTRIVCGKAEGLLGANDPQRRLLKKCSRLPRVAGRPDGVLVHARWQHVALHSALDLLFHVIDAGNGRPLEQRDAVAGRIPDAE